MTTTLTAELFVQDPLLNSKDLRAFREELVRWLFDRLQGTVVAGPFKGMKLLPELAWKDGRLGPMLLGCHEEELHGIIEQQIERLQSLSKPRLAVIGCAEGYYAVGLKKRLPEATVFAVDTDDEAIKLSYKAAQLNGVELVFGAALDDIFSDIDFLFLDCEGAEVGYLDPKRWPAVNGAHVLVELHNLIGQDTDVILLSRFKGTHHLTLLFEGARNPNKYKFLANLHSDQRWAIVSEGRPCLMSWFVMEPKGRALS